MTWLYVLAEIHMVMVVATRSTDMILVQWKYSEVENKEEGGERKLSH